MIASLLLLLQRVDSRLTGAAIAALRIEPSIRVVGGQDVTAQDSDEFQFFVNLGGCSGSIVHGDIVLTAAHVRVVTSVFVVVCLRWEILTVTLAFLCDIFRLLPSAPLESETSFKLVQE